MVKRSFPWILKGGLSVGLVAWVLKDIDLAQAWEQAKGIDPAMLTLAAGLMVCQIGLGALRWGMVLAALDSRLGALRTLMVYYIGIFFSLVLPGAVGGDAVRMFFARRAGLALGSAITSVMLERVATVFGLVLLVAATQPLLLARVPDIPGSWVFPLLSVLGLAGILVLTLADRLPDSLRHLRVVRGLDQLAGDTRRLFFRPSRGGPTLVVAILGHANLSMVAWVLALGVGVDLDPLDCLVLIPPVILLMTLPISIAGWGVREQAMVTFLGFVGVAEASAVVVSVLFGLVSMATALPGGLAWLASGERRPIAEIEAESR